MASMTTNSEKHLVALAEKHLWPPVDSSAARIPLPGVAIWKAADFVAETFEADTVSICQYDYLSGLAFLIVKTVTESWCFLKDFKIIFVGTRKHPTESTI